ncbi:MAG: sigma 54-interacting transcriptional regulator [Chloroflexota bacterium]
MSDALLKKESSMLNTVLDSLCSAVIVTDIEGNIAFLNKSAEELTGSLKDVGGQPLERVMQGSKIGEVLANGDRVLGNKVQFKNRMYLSDATPILENGEIKGAVAILLDISKSYEVSRQLEAVEQLNYELNALFDLSADGLVICNGEGIPLKINPAYEQIVGIKAEDFIGKHVTELVHRGVMKDLVTTKVLETRQVASIYQEIRGREVLLTGAPVFDERGRIVRVIANVRDLTELNSLRRRLSESAVKLALYQNELSRLNAESIGDGAIINSPEMQKVMDLALRVAPVDTIVLITGESGVGKEVIARVIHETSARTQGPFVQINCGALPPTLIESELFGYDSGAFTGARAEGKEGLFEAATGGTLLMDEIGDLPIELQVKLLRAIQKQEFTRLGGTKVIKVDVRILASTNLDLTSLVEAGKFRKDLFFRLNVVNIHVPALRERASDIPPLVDFFVRRFGKRYNLYKRVPADLMERFLGYSWPGNIRELENTIERLVVLSHGDLLDGSFFDASIFPNITGPLKSKKDQQAQTDRDALLNAYRRYSSTRKVAALLGVNQSTIVRKLKKYGVDISRQKMDQ